MITQVFFLIVNIIYMDKGQKPGVYVPSIFNSTNFNTESNHQYISIIMKTFMNIYSSYRCVRVRLADLTNKNPGHLGKLKFQT